MLAAGQAGVAQIAGRAERERQRSTAAGIVGGVARPLRDASGHRCRRLEREQLAASREPLDEIVGREHDVERRLAHPLLEPLVGRDLLSRDRYADPSRGFGERLRRGHPGPAQHPQRGHARHGMVRALDVEHRPQTLRPVCRRRRVGGHVQVVERDVEAAQPGDDRAIDRRQRRDVVAALVDQHEPDAQTPRERRRARGHRVESGERDALLRQRVGGVGVLAGRDEQQPRAGTPRSPAAPRGRAPPGTRGHRSPAASAG